MPTKNHTEINTLTEKVKEGQFTVNGHFLKIDRDNNTAPSIAERRAFWLQQWISMQGVGSTHKSLGNGESEGPSKHTWGYGRGRRMPEKWKEQLESGKTPMEIWQAQVEEMDKTGSTKIYGHEVFPNEEVKEKWNTAKTEGKTEDFWYSYWDDVTKEHFPIDRRFGHPRELQEKWRTLQAEGKTPDEIWREMGRDRWKMKRWNHHHRGCGFWNRHFTKKSRELDESDIYQQFDF